MRGLDDWITTDPRDRLTCKHGEYGPDCEPCNEAKEEAMDRKADNWREED